MLANRYVHYAIAYLALFTYLIIPVRGQAKGVKRSWQSLTSYTFLYNRIPFFYCINGQTKNSNGNYPREKINDV